MPKRLLKKRFGVMVLVSAAIWGMFIDQRRNPDLLDSAPGISENIIDSYSTQLQSREFGGNGQLKNHVAAASAKHYRISDVSLLEAPRLTNYADSGHIWDTEAPKGRVRAGGSIYDLWGGVQTKRRGKGGNIGEDKTVVITTEALSYYSQTGTARSDKKVRIDAALGITEGTGLEANFSQETVKLTSKVTGTYVLEQ
jgi:lipopolysaccharide export system protein LptC